MGVAGHAPLVMQEDGPLLAAHCRRIANGTPQPSGQVGVAFSLVRDTTVIADYGEMLQVTYSNAGDSIIQRNSKCTTTWSAVDISAKDKLRVELAKGRANDGSWARRRRAQGRSSGR
jgi:hypothetical protein